MNKKLTALIFFLLYSVVLFPRGANKFIKAIKNTAKGIGNAFSSSSNSSVNSVENTNENSASLKKPLSSGIDVPKVEDKKSKEVDKDSSVNSLDNDLDFSGKPDNKIGENHTIIDKKELERLQNLDKLHKSISEEQRENLIKKTKDLSEQKKTGENFTHKSSNHATQAYVDHSSFVVNNLDNPPPISSLAFTSNLTSYSNSHNTNPPPPPMPPSNIHNLNPPPPPPPSMHGITLSSSFMPPPPPPPSMDGMMTSSSVLLPPPPPLLNINKSNSLPAPPSISGMVPPLGLPGLSFSEMSLKKSPEEIEKENKLLEKRKEELRKLMDTRFLTEPELKELKNTFVPDLNKGKLISKHIEEYKKNHSEITSEEKKDIAIFLKDLNEYLNFLKKDGNDNLCHVEDHDFLELEKRTKENVYYKNFKKYTPIIKIKSKDELDLEREELAKKTMNKEKNAVEKNLADEKKIERAKKIFLYEAKRNSFIKKKLNKLENRRFISSAGIFNEKSFEGEGIKHIQTAFNNSMLAKEIEKIEAEMALSESQINDINEKVLEEERKNISNGLERELTLIFNKPLDFIAGELKNFEESPGIDFKSLNNDSSLDYYNEIKFKVQKKVKADKIKASEEIKTAEIKSKYSKLKSYYSGLLKEVKEEKEKSILSELISKIEETKDLTLENLTSIDFLIEKNASILEKIKKEIDASKKEEKEKKKNSKTFQQKKEDEEVRLKSGNMKDLQRKEEANKAKLFISEASTSGREKENIMESLKKNFPDVHLTENEIELSIKNGIEALELNKSNFIKKN